jgi:hypothetical protein
MVVASAERCRREPERDGRSGSKSKKAPGNPTLTCFSRLEIVWSGRRDSNPRPQPWQGCALPLSYTRIRDSRAVLAARPGYCPKAAGSASALLQFSDRRVTASQNCGENGPIPGRSRLRPIHVHPLGGALGAMSCLRSDSESLHRSRRMIARGALPSSEAQPSFRFLRLPAAACGLRHRATSLVSLADHAHAALSRRSHRQAR